MSDRPDTEWKAQPPTEFHDRRYVMGNPYRADRVDHYRHVRAFRAVVARRKDGKVEYDRCPHAHAKRSTARKCADRAARILNRNGGEWPKKPTDTDRQAT